jgi:hypothetical protein
MGNCKVGGAAHESRQVATRCTISNFHKKQPTKIKKMLAVF